MGLQVPQRDQGFTFAELSIAMSVALVVLTISYAIFEAGLNGVGLVEGNAAASRHAAHSLHVMTRYMREAEYLDHAADNALRYRADHDDDGQFEEIYYYYDTARSRLVEEVRELSSPGATQRVLAEHVRNAGNEPIFSYAKRDASPAVPDLDGENGERLTLTWRITVMLKVDVDPSKRPDAFRLKTDVHLRNQV